MGISSVEFSKIYEDDTKCNFQLDMSLNKTFTEEGYAVSRVCEVKPALQEAESHSWPSCWMMVCFHTSFVCTESKSAHDSERAAFFPKLFRVDILLCCSTWLVAELNSLPPHLSPWPPVKL